MSRRRGAATPRQSVRSLRSRDGVQLAWAEVGSGPALLKASNWLTHLQFEWQTPVWCHWLEFLAAHFRFIRYDERGCGMSQLDIEVLPPERWVDDLEDVAAVANLDEPVALLGISQGAVPAISYAAAHPERVSHLILYGGYARGWAKRADRAGLRRYQAMVELVAQDWGKDNPAVRNVFTTSFVPDAHEDDLRHLNELCRRTVPARNAAALLASRAHVDVSHLLEKVKVPTLVLHSRDDQVVPLAESRLLAAGIAGAELLELESNNHLILEHEPAWSVFTQAVGDFTGVTATGKQPESEVFAQLSPRQRQVLAQLTEGLANAEIAGRLGISEKTVRNHVSQVFDKLGVWSRAQAIVFAHEHGFRAT